MKANSTSYHVRAVPDAACGPLVPLAMAGENPGSNSIGLWCPDLAPFPTPPSSQKAPWVSPATDTLILVYIDSGTDRGKGIASVSGNVLNPLGGPITFVVPRFRGGTGGGSNPSPPARPLC